MSDNITLPREVVELALDALDYGGFLKKQQSITALRTALAAEQPKHPGYVIGNHWLETAYSRVCAGEAEADVLRDCGWERVDEALRRDAESWRKSREKYTAWQKGTDLLETIHLQHAENERLKAENEALRRDAESWRRLMSGVGSLDADMEDKT